MSKFNEQNMKAYSSKTHWVCRMFSSKILGGRQVSLARWVILFVPASFFINVKQALNFPLYCSFVYFILKWGHSVININGSMVSHNMDIIKLVEPVFPYWWLCAYHYLADKTKSYKTILVVLRKIFGREIMIFQDVQCGDLICTYIHNQVN